MKYEAKIKKDLVIVQNKYNNKGSELYLKQIKRQHEELFKDDINLSVVSIDDQDVLEDVMFNKQNSKFLLLTPTSLHIPYHMSNKNAEQNQTATIICNYVMNNFFVPTTKILLIGKGIVNKEVFNKLCLKEGYCVTMHGKEFCMEQDFSEKFDVIVNAISHDSSTELYINCDSVLDVSGNFVPIDKVIPIEDNREIVDARISSRYKEFKTMRDIGKRTTNKMLSDILE